MATAGFRTVTATGNIHRGIIAGKLNGQIPATTPADTFRLHGFDFKTLHTERLPVAVRIDITANVLDRFTHHQRRCPACMFNNLEAARDIANRISHDLAVLLDCKASAPSQGTGSTIGSSTDSNLCFLQ